jgi:hypothetical protein
MIEHPPRRARRAQSVLAQVVEVRPDGRNSGGSAKSMRCCDKGHKRRPPLVRLHKLGQVFQCHPDAGLVVGDGHAIRNAVVHDEDTSSPSASVRVVVIVIVIVISPRRFSMPAKVPVGTRHLAIASASRSAR